MQSLNKGPFSSTVTKQSLLEGKSPSPFGICCLPQPSFTKPEPQVWPMPHSVASAGWSRCYTEHLRSLEPRSAWVHLSRVTLGLCALSLPQDTHPFSRPRTQCSSCCSSTYRWHTCLHHGSVYFFTALLCLAHTPIIIRIV